MRGIFGVLYIFLFMGAVLMGFFILFHISRYALNRRVAFVAAVLFTTVLAFLLIANAYLFFHIPFDSLLSNNTFFPR